MDFHSDIIHTCSVHAAFIHFFLPNKNGAPNQGCQISVKKFSHLLLFLSLYPGNKPTGVHTVLIDGIYLAHRNGSVHHWRTPCTYTFSLFAVVYVCRNLLDVILIASFKTRYWWLLTVYTPSPKIFDHLRTCVSHLHYPIYTGYALTWLPCRNAPPRPDRAAKHAAKRLVQIGEAAKKASITNDHQLKLKSVGLDSDAYNSPKNLWTLACGQKSDFDAGEIH